MKNIGIDARLAISSGGIGRYTRDLVKGLGTYGKEFKYYAIVYDSQEISWIPQSIKTVNVSPIRKKKLPFVWEHLILPRKLKALDINLMHFPHTNVPMGFSGKFVATVHDLAIYSHPEWFPKGQFLSTKSVVPKAIKRANMLVSVSESVKKDIVSLFSIDESKISVIPNGIDLNLFKPGKNPSRDYLLFVGSGAPYKNPSLLNEICKKLDMPCKVAGASRDEFEKALSSGQVADNIEFVGKLPYDSAELIELYQNAVCLLQTSLYESFALPILESLACSTPVIAADIPSLHTIYGDNISYASLNNVSDWVNKVNVLKHQKMEINREFVNSFSWEENVKKLESIYQKVLA